MTALDESDAGDRPEKAELLEVLGADVRLGAGATATLPDDVDLRGHLARLAPTRRCSRRPRARGIPVWGEVELAWRLRDPDHDTPWLCVTGTNGKTTTVQMLDAILRAAGLRSVAVGNVGLPIVEAVMDPEPYDVLAVELVQLPAALHRLDERPGRRRAQRRRGPPRLVPGRRMADYAADKGRIYERVQRACVYNVADPATEQLVREADVVEGARAVGFTLGMPGVGMVGVVEDILADRAFVEERDSSAAELCTLADLGRSPAPHIVANALAAAALARAHGVSQAAVRDGLRGFRPDGHRIAVVGRARRRHLGRRLQGHQPARRPVLAAGLRPGRLGRRRPGQGRDASTTWCRRSPTGCAASCCSAATAT